MTIKSTPFGKTQLSGDDAARFVELIRKKQLNPRAARTLRRGRDVLAKMKAKPE